MVDDLTKDTINFNKTYISKTLFNISDPYENNCNWEIHIKGRGTYLNRETFKKEGYLWNSNNKCWYKKVNKDSVPIKYIKKQKLEEKEHYNYLRKFDNIFSQKYCQNDDCFNGKSRSEPYCPNCKYKMSLTGDLERTG